MAGEVLQRCAICGNEQGPFIPDARDGSTRYLCEACLESETASQPLDYGGLAAVRFLNGEGVVFDV